MVLAVLLLIGGLTGEVHPQTLEGVGVHAGQDDGGVHIAALELGELPQRDGGSLILGGRAGQRDEDLIGVQAGVAAAEVVGLEGLDRLDGAGGDEVDLLIDAGQLLEGVQEECISQPLSLESCRSAMAAVSFSAAELDSAMRISSVCRRGLRLPR